MNSLARPDDDRPLHARRRRRRRAPPRLTRRPTSTVGSPGSEAITRSRIRTVMSGTAFGTVSVLVAPGTPILWPCESPASLGVAPVLERHAGDVVQRPALLLRAGEERDAGERLRRRPCARRRGPGRRSTRASSAGRAPGRGVIERPACCQASNIASASRRPTRSAMLDALAVEARRLVALVRVAVDVDDHPLRRDVARRAHAPLEHADRRAVVVLVVEPVRRRDDRAVVGERRPAADRDRARAGACRRAARTTTRSTRSTCTSGSIVCSDAVGVLLDACPRRGPR